ncbi:MAG: hypothetical protein VKI82_09060 [Leptolyngbya sp.]|nr:hypothetical protein [Leptolyngbya sp.]
MAHFITTDWGPNLASGPRTRRSVFPNPLSPDPSSTTSVPPAAVPLDLAPSAVDLAHPATPPEDAPSEVQLSLPMEIRDLEAEAPSISPVTLGLATQDVRTVLREQNEQGQLLTTKLNILFVANSALLTSLSISRLLVSGNLFSLAEILGFLISFSLLMRAFLPRQVAVTPNLEDRTFLETYLALSARNYQLQMLVNLAETYNANKQRLEDVSQGLKYAAYAIWGTTAIMLINIVVIYITKGLQAPAP